MNLVSIALRRPVTVLVLIVATVLTGLFAVSKMSRDVFPPLGVPVLYVAQPYSGMSPAQMEGFLVNYYEYHFLYITGIEHVESKSIEGAALIKLQFHPGTDMAAAMAETVSYVNRARSFMPPGTVPPFVMRFDAGSVPVGDLVFTDDSGKLALKDLQDAALFRVRPLFATLPGVSAPPPFGGSPRTLVVSADPDRLRAYAMSPDEVVQAVARGNTISPSGNVRIGDRMPIVAVNSVAADAQHLREIPIRYDGTRTISVGDIGTVADAADIETGYALVNGHRTVYIPVTKRADASTLSVVNLVKANLPKFQAQLPPGVKVSYEFDQSPYVTRAIAGLASEGLLGALLTGFMVMVFLRDWRSAAVVMVNIPLALLAAAIALWLSGQTVNLMTLGGLALAVGMLVDEATVVVENVHAHLAHGAHRPRGTALARAVYDGTIETMVPNLLAMLCILAVFVSAFFMQGAVQNLFVPLALAVAFAMVASFLLSRTLVPILLARFAGASAAPEVPWFERLRGRYQRLAARAMARRGRLVAVYLLVACAIVVLVGVHLGREIFPAVDTGQFAFRMRAPAGTRIEETEKLAKQTLEIIRREAGADRVQLSLGFVGVQNPAYPISTIYLWTSGADEAVLQVQLKPSSGIKVADLEERLRHVLARELPTVRYSFEPNDIVSKVMSLGATTPVEVAVTGPDLNASRAYALRVREALRGIDALRDLQFEQELDYPSVNVEIDRRLAGTLGVSADQVGRAVTDAAASSRFVAPNFWADPKNGVGYQVQVQVPPTRLNSLEELRNLPVGRSPYAPISLRSIAQVKEGSVLGEYDRYNGQRMLTLGANLVAGADLGHVASDVDQTLKTLGQPPKGITVTVRGQIVPMRDMFAGLALGIGVAIVAIYLLLAAYFQSLRLPLAMVLVIPAVLAGAAVVLAVTGTTLNLQSLMGAIMAIGVAVANAILLVSFAERRRLDGATAIEAAATSASSRLRPILMTSSAMIAGMLPMAAGLGEGGAQTAPLGRAVIGGLLGATFATLVILPALFAMLQHRQPRRSASLHPDTLPSPSLSQMESL